MLKRNFAIVILLLLVLAGAWFWFGNLNYARPSQILTSANSANLHFASDSGKALSKINIQAFYFVPASSTPESDDLWKQQLTQSLTQTADFYKAQLNGGVNIVWNIYPTAIVGEQPSIFYDTSDSSKGNPHALLSIRQELLKRFPSVFSETDKNSATVIAILYEGVGSSGTWTSNKSNADTQADVVGIDDNLPPALLVSSYYFTGASYKDYSTSIFAHEFGHVLGLPDNYSLVTGQPKSDDIMGSGRFRPLNYNYLSSENKKLLGLEY